MEEQTILNQTSSGISEIVQEEIIEKEELEIQTELIANTTSLNETHYQEPGIDTELGIETEHEKDKVLVTDKEIDEGIEKERENLTLNEVVISSDLAIEIEKDKELENLENKELNAEDSYKATEEAGKEIELGIETVLEKVENKELNAEDSNKATEEESGIDIAIGDEIPQAIIEPSTEAGTDIIPPVPVAVKTPEKLAEELEQARIRSEKQKAKEKRQKEQEERKRNFEEVFNKLKTIKENNEIIEVEVQSRIKGGLRVYYEHAQLFLPASHFSLKRNPPEKEIYDSVGKKLKVYIHELQEDEQGRKTVIVSRKNILEDDFWTQINVGDIVEGTVSSIASFGVFVDIGGIEGLIHISRLSQVHVEDPREFVKKGQRIQTVVIEVDRAKNRIALSKKELEESPWKNAMEKYPVGSQFKGTVRRLTEFGAYVELTPGVDGLLRTGELSWTKRVKKPADILKPFEEITVEVLSVNEEKQTMTLSYKRTMPNPWYELKEKYPIGMEFNAKVTQIVPQGAIISLTDDIDGFMPRSKMKNLLKGKKIPYQPDEFIDVIISEIIPEEESLILAPKAEEEVARKEENENKKPVENKREKIQNNKDTDQGSFTILDILSDKGNYLESMS